MDRTPSSSSLDVLLAPAAARADPRPGSTTSEGKRACVLVAEDEDLVRELAIEVLDANGFDAIAARHGGEALSLFSEHAEHIDAVLLDLSMPVLDGARVLGEMRKQKPSIRVVLTSGFDGPDDGLTDADGPISFLQKPYRAHKLVEQIRALLACS
jgi:CheY-like chemotaxis protein